jgi:hypothetical protein
MQNKDDYLFFKDIDDATCATRSKGDLQARLQYLVPEDRIVIVIKEIEGWYLAGLTVRASQKLNIPYLWNG